MEATGTCYKDAADFVLAQDCGEALLVHGRPTLQVPPYEPFGHAWVEVGDKVIDPATGFEGPRVIYYALGNIDPEENIYYTVDETRTFMLSHEHWGPWEGPTGVPMTDEQRESWLDLHDELPTRSPKDRGAPEVF